MTDERMEKEKAINILEERIKKKRQAAKYLENQPDIFNDNKELLKQTKEEEKAMEAVEAVGEDRVRRFYLGVED